MWCGGRTSASTNSSSIGCAAIVTGDGDFLADEALRLWLQERGVEVQTPVELLERLG